MDKSEKLFVGLILVTLLIATAAGVLYAVQPGAGYDSCGRFFCVGEACKTFVPEGAEEGLSL